MDELLRIERHQALRLDQIRVMLGVLTVIAVLFFLVALAGSV